MCGLANYIIHTFKDNFLSILDKNFILDGLVAKVKLLIFKSFLFKGVVDLKITICLYLMKISLWIV